MKKTEKIFLLIGTLVVFLFASCDQEEQAKPPNVVLFLVDDLGWVDTSTYGSDFYQTRFVDQLAKQGVVFTNAYAASTVCSPTRASILTGKYPATLHTTDWIKGHQKPFAKLAPPNWTMYLKDDEVTLAEALKQEGYKTAHIGKWHLGEKEENWPENHGFDINIGGWKTGMPKRVKGQGGYFTPYHNPRLEDGPEDEYLTERLAQEASQFIVSHKDNPFFLNLWLYNVHTPLQARKEKVAKYEKLSDSTKLHSNETYAAMVEHMDDALGVVINELKKQGLYENTILIFASDNGGLIGNRGKQKKPRVTSNVPLREGKGGMYEGGVRVPFIISWPNKITPRKTEVLSISPDIFPTVLSLVNSTQANSEKQIDGQDLSDFLLKDTKPVRDQIFWHYPHYHTEGAKPYSAVRKGDWKLIHFYETDSLELYNLKQDISETTNLSEIEQTKTNELRSLLKEWKAKVKAQDPIENPKYDPQKEYKWRNQWKK